MMMKHLLKLLFLFLFFSCGGEGGVGNRKTTATQTTADSTKPATEFLEWKDMKINGRLPLISRKDQFTGLLGQPDSIVIPNMDDICTSFFDNRFSYLFYGNSQFELSGDSVVISSISFTDNRIRLQAGNILLDKTFTLEKMASLFPKAVAEKNEVELDKTGKAVSVMLATSRVAGDDGWILFFRDGKLIRIDYWIPC